MTTLVRPAMTFAIAALSFACSDAPSEDAAAAGGGNSDGASRSEVAFSDDIHPILLAKCGASGCHDGSQAPILPGHGAADVQQAYDATRSISPTGEPVYERILTRISTTEPNYMMPPSFANPPCRGTIGTPGCISEAELALIQEWIDAGAPL